MIFEKVQEIIADKLSLEVTEIKMESSFSEDLRADSIELFELIVALEDEFDLEIPEEEAEKVSTVGDIVNYIKTKVEE